MVKATAELDEGTAAPGRRPMTPHRILEALAILAAALLWSGIASAVEDEDLTALSLEDLMSVRLNAMGITGIHHTHARGEWMVGLSLMHMHMDGNRSAGHRVSRAEVLRDYPVAPTEMDMDMAMLHLMVAPTDRWTLVGMVPYLRLEMEHETRSGASFTTRADGLGDVELGALFRLWAEDIHRVDLLGMVRLPTGSIDVKDDTPMGRTRLPYPMRLGSGSVDLHPGVTYQAQTETWSWGVHAGTILRTHRNHRGYRLGHRAHVTTWLARGLTEWLSASVRLDGAWWGNIHGDDDALDPALVPTADPDRRAGRRVDLLLGTNIFSLEGPLAGHRIAVEGGVPITQWLDGPQLELDYRLSLEWTWVF
jgi:hypothetical protein